MIFKKGLTEEKPRHDRFGVLTVDSRITMLKHIRQPFIHMGNYINGMF